jgi:MFS family permease
LIVLAFVFLYISSVFRFILFDSVLRRECSISEGWRKWHRAGGRFFLWQIVFQISASLFLALLIGLPLALALAAGWTTDLKEHVGRLIVGVILLAGLFGVFVLTAAVVQVLARDFLVPIMALEGLDFADGWHRLLAMIRPEKGRFAIYLLLKLVLSIAAAILFGIIALIPGLFIFVPAAVAVVAGHAAGMGWNVTTISLAIIFGSLLLLLFIYLIALVSVPATVFFPAYAIYFFAARYPNLNALLNPAPVPPAPELPPVPESPAPFEAPPLPPSAEPIG